MSTRNPEPQARIAQDTGESVMDTQGKDTDTQFENDRYVKKNEVTGSELEKKD